MCMYRAIEKFSIESSSSRSMGAKSRTIIDLVIPITLGRKLTLIELEVPARNSKRESPSTMMLRCPAASPLTVQYTSISDSLRIDACWVAQYPILQMLPSHSAPKSILSIIRPLRLDSSSSLELRIRFTVLAILLALSLTSMAFLASTSSLQTITFSSVTLESMSFHLPFKLKMIAERGTPLICLPSKSSSAFHWSMVSSRTWRSEHAWRRVGLARSFAL
mmetsp:Transcript_28968/g.49988  ORF Transcript_28968/g.49988 Transcript_28968/m.49988 type:complete len:220 (+) Transcript_28968:2675-3334(+)